MKKLLKVGTSLLSAILKALLLIPMVFWGSLYLIYPPMALHLLFQAALAARWLTHFLEETQNNIDLNVFREKQKQFTSQAQNDVKDGL